MKKPTDWGSVRVRQDLIDRMARALNTEHVRQEGFTNVAQFTDHVIREALATLENKRFQHINKYEDHVKILDNRIGKMGRIVSVYYREGLNPVCDYCEESACVHVQYAWELDDVRSALIERGLRPPPARL